MTLQRPPQRHLIVGAGNLGVDIGLRLAGEPGGVNEVVFAGRRQGLDCTDFSALLRLVTPVPYDYIWWCVGGWSVEQFKADAEQGHKVMYAAPRLVAQYAHPRSRLMFFSTDYCAHEEHMARPDLQVQVPTSEYAEVRKDLESFIAKYRRPHTAVFRLGSLYGAHHPQNTFPGKVLARHGAGTARIDIPLNDVTPTSTKWAAAMVCHNRELLVSEEGPKRHHLAPRGNVALRDWAKMLLHGLRGHRAFDETPWVDTARPAATCLGTSWMRQNPHWNEVWGRDYRRELYLPVRAAPNV